MKLNYQGIQDRAAWEKAGVKLPGFDWRHGGRDGKGPYLGPLRRWQYLPGLHRPSSAVPSGTGTGEGGIVAADTFDYDIIDKITPRPAKVVEEALNAAGMEDMAPIVTGKLGPILSNPVLFGSNLVALGLGEKIEGMVKEMLTGAGAVRATLQKYLKN